MIAATVNRDTFTVSTPSECEIQMTRTFNAPRELVFEAMTKPEHVRQWWGRLGEGYSVPVCEIDFRVGGKWRFVNRHPQGEAEFYGEYREIAAPGRVVFTEIFAPFPDSPSVVTAELADFQGKTHFKATVRYPSQTVRDMVMSTGMANGAATSYDRLEDLLAALTAAAAATS
ncbi:MAG: SRPBCC family protein [Bryobacterales bacterium]|nr:SRPBCC family protein [Bryobacterales bacterium]